MKKFVVFLMMCVTLLVTIGCKDNDYRKAVRASGMIASGLQSMQTFTEDNYNQNKLDREDALRLSMLTLDAVKVNDQLISQLKSIKTGELDQSTLKVVVFTAEKVLQSVAELNNDAVLHIKDDDSRAKATIIMASVKASLDTLQALIEASSVPTPVEVTQ